MTPSPSVPITELARRIAEDGDARAAGQFVVQHRSELRRAAQGRDASGMFQSGTRAFMQLTARGKVRSACPEVLRVLVARIIRTRVINESRHEARYRQAISNLRPSHRRTDPKRSPPRIRSGDYPLARMVAGGKTASQIAEALGVGRAAAERRRSRMIERARRSP